MPLARLCSAMPSLPAVPDRGDILRGLTGAKPSTSRVSTAMWPSASVSAGLLRLAGRWPIDELCLQTPVLLLLGAGGSSVLLLLPKLLLVRAKVPAWLLEAIASGVERPEALKPAQGAAKDSCCWLLLASCSLDAAAGCSRSRLGSTCSWPAILTSNVQIFAFAGGCCAEGGQATALAGETLLAVPVTLDC
jgi:hypothetical protein